MANFFLWLWIFAGRRGVDFGVALVRAFLVVLFASIAVYSCGVSNGS